MGSALADPELEVPMSRDHRKLRVFHDARLSQVSLHRAGVGLWVEVSGGLEWCIAVVKQLERLTQTMEMEASAEKEKSDRRP